MRIYSSFGFTDFIVCCGYKGYVIKEFFKNFHLHSSDVTVDLGRNTIDIHEARSEPWRVTLIDTGESTATAGRLKRVAKYLDGDSYFLFTYGDGLANVDLNALIDTHFKFGRLATLTAVQPPGRFGALKLDNGRISSFSEKSDGMDAWINGGFFVVSTQVLEQISGDESSWEVEVLPKLAEANELSAYLHTGFWQPMDTLRDKQLLERLCQKGKPPWLDFHGHVPSV
jgi:glucose-1-phosphate cytidylyltransferase